MWQLGSAAMSRGWQQAKREQDSQCPDLIRRPIWTRYKPIWTHKGPCGTLWVRPGPFLRGETILESFTFWNFRLFHQNHSLSSNTMVFKIIITSFGRIRFKRYPMPSNWQTEPCWPTVDDFWKMIQTKRPVYTWIIYGKKKRRRKEQLPDSLRLFFFFLLRRP